MDQMLQPYPFQRFMNSQPYHGRIQASNMTWSWSGIKWWPAPVFFLFLFLIYILLFSSRCRNPLQIDLTLGRNYLLIPPAPRHTLFHLEM